MLTFKKDDGVKYIDPISDLIPLLHDLGWKCDQIKTESEQKALKLDEDKEPDERVALFKKAKMLGLKPHPRTGIKKLKSMIEKAGA